jgi:hypothetical protein
VEDWLCARRQVLPSIEAMLITRVDRMHQENDVCIF